MASHLDPDTNRDTGSHTESGSGSGSAADRPDGRREARFRTLVEVTTTLIWVMSPDGLFVEPQPSLEAFTGLDHEQIVGDRWQNAVHPDDIAGARQKWAAFLATKSPAEILYRLRRSDGEYRLMRARAVPMLDADGRVVEWVGANEDVTEAQRTHDEMHEREMRLQAFADVLPHIAWESDISGAVVWLNSRFYEYTGMTPGDGLQWSWVDIFHPDDIDAYVAAWRNAVTAGEVFRFEARMRRHDGTMRWMRSVAELLRDGNGLIQRWYGTATDIEDARQGTERINRFVATLSHELRNPLAPIRNGLMVMKSEALPASAKSATVEMMERQVGHMVRLIDDLMDFNRIASDKLILRLEPSELQAEIRHAIDSCRPLLDTGRHELSVELPSVPLAVLADRTRLSQIFGNLLMNAAKFSADGAPVRLRAAMRDGAALVEIEDQGIGLAPERIDDVFQMFSQVNASASGTLGGLGIGLSIARRLVEMHGGTLHAHSDGLGKGSRFVVTLPLHVAPHSVASEAPLQGGNGDGKPPRRILIVDDNRDAADSLATLMEIMGHQTRVAHDGAQALNAVTDFDPDIAVLDIGLPDISGYELAPRVRAAMRTPTPIVLALTGWGQERDRKRSLEAGFDAHLVKPVDMTLLQKILEDGPASVSGG